MKQQWVGKGVEVNGQNTENSNVGDHGRAVDVT